MESNLRPSEIIRRKVLSWNGVTAHAHRFGGVEFRVGKRELGHMHGDTLVDIPFPRRIHDDVIAKGLAVVHRIVPDSGWVSKYIRTPEDVEQATELFRIAFDLAQKKFK